MCLKCSWNPILFGFCFLTWLSLENWDSLAQTDTQQIDTWQINFAGSIMTMELYSAQDSGHLHTRRDNNLDHLPSKDIVPVDNTPLPRYNFPCARGFMWMFFMVSITSQIDIALENENFPGLLEDLWTLHFQRDSLDFYNRACEQMFCRLARLKKSSEYKNCFGS